MTVVVASDTKKMMSMSSDRTVSIFLSAALYSITPFLVHSKGAKGLCNSELEMILYYGMYVAKIIEPGLSHYAALWYKRSAIARTTFPKIIGIENTQINF